MSLSVKSLCCSAVVALLPQTLIADDFGEWASFVPPAAKATAEVMVLDVPEDINGISQRVEQAMQKNPEWFKNYALEAEPGKPLTYHENMGITKDEHQRLLQGANELVLVKAGDVEIAFSVDENGNITLRGLPMTAPNDHLVYDPKSNYVHTAHGVLTDYKAFDQNDTQVPTGAWAGLQWSLNKLVSATDFVQIKLSIGKMKDQELNMIYYDVNALQNGIHDQYHYILIYHGV